MNCTKCGAAIPEGKNFCVECGEHLPEKPEVRKCSKCGTEMSASMNFCPKCHAGIEGSAQQTAYAAGVRPPSKSSAKKMMTAAAGLIGGLILIGGSIALGSIRPWLVKKARCQSLEKVLVKDVGFKAGSVEVRHLNGLRFGVWVIRSSMDGKAAAYWHDAEKPAFTMVLNEDTNKWEIPAQEDKEEVVYYGRLSNGNNSARCRNLEKVLVKDAGFRSGFFEVRHLDGLRFGVWVISIKMNGKAAAYWHDAEKPAFTMVFKEDTGEWEPRTQEDKKNLPFYSRLSHGDESAIIEQFQ